MGYAGIVASVVALAIALGGCGKRIELPERGIRGLASATQLARSRGAYERAVERVEGVGHGLSAAEVEEEMGGFVAVERRTGADGEPLERRSTIVEGLLCERTVSETSQRWLFGYDEDRVVLVGFAIEFERDEEGDEWRVRRIDYLPEDECGRAAERQLTEGE